MTTTHPKTGFHYIHIFRPDEVFFEIRGCYNRASERLPWMSIQEDTEWHAGKAEWQDPGNMLIFWGFELPELPESRRASFGIKYLESVGKPDGMIPVQQQCIKGLFKWALEPDIVFTGSPSALAFLKPHCRKVTLFPIGYEPEVMGVPAWSTPKTHDIAVYGADVGRRRVILDAARRRFKNRLLDINVFNEERKKAIEGARSVLYVGHSEEVAFPGMRLWQMIAASTALITERRDSWPADPDRHMITLEPVDMHRIHAFLDGVEDALEQDLEAIARAAHTDLSRYTVERCMEEFVVPATEGLRRA